MHRLRRFQSFERINSVEVNFRRRKKNISPSVPPVRAEFASGLEVSSSFFRAKIRCSDQNIFPHCNRRLWSWWFSRSEFQTLGRSIPTCIVSLITPQILEYHWSQNDGERVIQLSHASLVCLVFVFFYATLWPPCSTYKVISIWCFELSLCCCFYQLWWLEKL